MDLGEVCQQGGSRRSVSVGWIYGGVSRVDLGEI